MLKSAVRLLIFGLLVATTVACGRVENRYNPTAIKESVTHEDTGIKYQQGILVIGASRDEVVQTFGQPNGSDQNNGYIEDVYIFMPDGYKYVNPSPRARNVALAVVTVGTSVAVRQARLAHQRTKLTIYHVYYSLDRRIADIKVEKGSAFKSPSKADT